VLVLVVWWVLVLTLVRILMLKRVYFWLVRVP
jgi:hypothetical protein